MRGLVISDLHLLAKRSVGASLLDGIRPMLDRCDMLILNGDTFDFRWSTLPDETESIAAAIAWLEARLDSMAGRDLHFIHGNHDCLHGFRDRLQPLAQRWPNLHLHEDALRIGDRIFLHGDCANRKMDTAALKAFRDQWASDKPRGGFSAKMYDIADMSGLSWSFHRCYFPRDVTVARVAHYLDSAIPGWRESANHCYFGHTHIPFRNHRHGDVSYHNTGSGIRGMGFQPIEFDYHENNS
jgi:UDP-2,3-diacylglucosamine hydrolase